MRRLTRLGRSSPARSRLKALRATGRLVAVSVARYTDDCSECATSLRISKRPILLADMPVLVAQARRFLRSGKTPWRLGVPLDDDSRTLKRFRVTEVTGGVYCPPTLFQLRVQHFRQAYTGEADAFVGQGQGGAIIGGSGHDRIRPIGG